MVGPLEETHPLINEQGKHWVNIAKVLPLILTPLDNTVDHY